MKIDALFGFLKDPRLKRRLLLCGVGIVFMALGVGLFRVSAMGVDPFQSLCSGLYRVIPLSEGITYILFNALLLIFALIFRPRSVGLGTFVNMFFLGFLIDGAEKLVSWVCGPQVSLAGQIILLVLGLGVISVGCSLYMTADLGISTYDFIAVRLGETGKLPFRVFRIFTDLVCVGLGMLLGAMPGIATLIQALLMGPIIAFFNKHLSEPLLNKKKL